MESHIKSNIDRACLQRQLSKYKSSKLKRLQDMIKTSIFLWAINIK